MRRYSLFNDHSRARAHAGSLSNEDAADRHRRPPIRVSDFNPVCSSAEIHELLALRLDLGGMQERMPASCRLARMSSEL
jgi:hypothetical protein